MPTTTKPKRAKKAAPAEQGIAAYKGFHSDLTCNGYQFAIGETFHHTGTVKACSSGFHACENPLDVLTYYPLIGDNGSLNRFCRVTVGGEVSRHTGDSKLAGAKITIDMELSLPAFIKAGVDWIIAAAKGSDTASGKKDAQLAASGDSSQLAASGDYSQLAASGDYSQLAASGYSSQLAASGNYSKLAASGYSSQLAASGYSSQLEITGAKSAAAAVGPGSRVKASAGTPVAICEYDRNGAPIGFATGIAGQDGIPSDVWLIARDGKLVEPS